MRPDGGRSAVAKTAALVIPLTLAAGPCSLYANQKETVKPGVAQRPPCCQQTAGNWQEFVEIEVRENELILTNISDRAIVAWTVRQVTRITEGNEGYGSITKDAAGHRLVPDGHEQLVHPGQSVTLQKPGEPWIRPDLKGPEYAVYYDVGALVFENAEWVGVPEVIDRIFERRLESARDALSAIEVITSGGELDRLPKRYRLRLQQFASPEEGLPKILGEARESLENAKLGLRPEDLAMLPDLGEVIR